MSEVTDKQKGAAKTEIAESELMKPGPLPENILGNPGYLSNNLVTITGGPVYGRTIIVHRTADPDNSGAGTSTTTDDQNVLSLGEVRVVAALRTRQHGQGLGPPLQVKRTGPRAGPFPFLKTLKCVRYRCAEREARGGRSGHRGEAPTTWPA